MFVAFSARFHTSALRALKPQEKHEIPMPFQRKPSSSFAGKSPSENLSLTPETSSKKPCPTPARNHARKTCQTKKWAETLVWKLVWKLVGTLVGEWAAKLVGKVVRALAENLGNLRRRPLGASRNMKHRISAAVADTKRKRAENVLWHTGT